MPSLAGAWVRSRADVREGRLDEVRLNERHRLARELHDSVAHHVTAIIVQAQAGRTVAKSDPAAAVEVLATIEEEASSTLDEMRKMVGLLREDSDDVMSPQQGIADIRGLAADGGPGRPAVHVELVGDLENLSPPIEAGLFRLAQESITNALRHSRNATRILVQVGGSSEELRLTVTDDGERVSRGWQEEPGYGLTGMAERVRLLGGEFQAGPEVSGWKLEASLPRGRAGS